MDKRKLAENRAQEYMDNHTDYIERAIDHITAYFNLFGYGHIEKKVTLRGQIEQTIHSLISSILENDYNCVSTWRIRVDRDADDGSMQVSIEI